MLTFILMPVSISLIRTCGVSILLLQVLLADEKSLEHSLAEPTAALLAAVQKK